MPLDEAGPRLVHLGLGPVLVDAADDLGRLHQRVVGAQRLGTVARGAPHGERAPEGPFLAHDDRQASHAVGAVHRESARLGDHVVGIDVVGGVPAEPSGAVGAERLLVGDGDVGEVDPAGRKPLGRDGAARWPWWR